MKLKNKCVLLSLVSLSFVLVNTPASFAKNEPIPKPIIKEYRLEGTNPESSTYKTPPAYEISNSQYFPDGTILYKHTYNDVTYYSPKPPENSIEAKGVSASYVDWGFWDFKPNHEKNKYILPNTLFRSNEYYSQARVKVGATAYGCSTNGSEINPTFLQEGTILNVRSITINIYGIEYVYFDTANTGVSSFNGIGRIESKYVEKANIDEETKILYFEEIKDRTNPCSAYYDNFKRYKTVLNRYLGSSHHQLQLSTEIVPETETSKTCNLAGKSGEWQYLGLSSEGNAVVNPYYPGDSVSFMGNGSLSYYDWRKTPWDDSDAENDERGDITNNEERLKLLKEDMDSFKYLYNSPTVFDILYKEEKIKLLQELMDDGNIVPVNGGETPILDAKQWADRVSLLTNPYDETPIFVGQRRVADYSQPFSFIKKTNDLYLSSIIIKDYNNDIIATGQRTSAEDSFTYNIKENLKKGGCYTVEVKLSKKLNDPIKASELHTNLQIFNSENTELAPLNNHYMSLPNKGGLTENNNTSESMYFHFIIPENYQGNAYTINAFVSGNHAGIDNLDYSNDSGTIPMKVIDTEIFDSGDIEPVSIQLLQGNTVVFDSRNPNSKNAIIPGETYSVLYTAKYVGKSLYAKKVEGVKWVDDLSKPYSASVPLTYSLTRKVGSAQNDEGIYKSGYFTDSRGSQTILMMSDTLLTFCINDVTFEHPYLEAGFNITSTNKKVNKDINNDSMSTKINDGFDVVISDVVITPNKEYIINPNNNYTFNVTYNATLNAPSYINSSNYKTLVETSININGTQKTFVDLLKPNTTTTNISHTVSGVSLGYTNGPYYGEVILNYNKKVYENGGYDNNRGVGYFNFEKVKNPSLGNSSDTAKNPYNGANSSANKGGDANNNCLIPRNTNTYNTTYSIYNWNSNVLSYKSFSGTNKINFYKYNILSESTQTSTNTENFAIKDVLFRSKYTKDKKLGNDGWVSMVNSSDSIIKAGYGFELKVVVEYKTNALLNNPEEKNNGTNGTFVTNLNSGINITPELFVEIPGNKKTVLSVYPQVGTKQGLDVKQTKSNVIENSMVVSEWEYTIKGSTTNGVQNVGRIFIPDNLKDGNYKLSIYTPPVSGVSSISEYNTFKYSALCDRKDTYVKVNGSATDDLNSHITQ